MRAAVIVAALVMACGPGSGKIGVDGDTASPTTGVPGTATGGPGTAGTTDADGDGWSVADGDCDDSDPAINPGATDFVDAGSRDENCDGVDGVDADGDGFADVPSGGIDCDDTNADIHPDAEEIWYDGVDQDCAGDDDYDQDGDGFRASEHGGDDCDDTDPIAQPLDLDEDGFTGCDGDCDDADPYVSPLDNDGDGASGCDGDCNDRDPRENITDVDGDGNTTCDGDCDDRNPNVERLDLDGDGVDTCDDDCDDEDPQRFPGAYDRPDDGIDQDCDGIDRRFDGVVLDVGEDVSVDLELRVAGASAVDLLLLIDTTCSMGGTVAEMAALSDSLPAELAAIGDVSVGVATYDDYNFDGMGGGADKPFILKQQQTLDPALAGAAMASLGLHGGADYPESGMEALFQAFAGNGYDQACDGVYDESDDVRPFWGDPADAFGGAVDGAASPDGLGELGGVGFRSGAKSIVALVTDNALRDPEADFATPGGCAFDAGRSDVLDAAAALDGWIMGFDVGGGLVAMPQLEDLAAATGAMTDGDGDGEVDTPMAYAARVSDLGPLITEAIEWAFDGGAADADPHELVELLVDADPEGLVLRITPPAHEDVAGDEVLPFTVMLRGDHSPEPDVRQVEVVLVLVADGEERQTVRIAVELPPA